MVKSSNDGDENRNNNNNNNLNQRFEPTFQYSIRRKLLPTPSLLCSFQPTNNVLQVMSSAWVWPLSRRRARVGALEPSDPTDGWQGSGSTYPPKSPGCGFSSPTRMIMKIYNVCCQPGNPDLNRLLFATSYWGWVGVDAKQWFVQNRFLLSKALAWLFWTCSAESPIYLIWLSIHPFCLSMYLIYTILFIYIYHPICIIW